MTLSRRRCTSSRAGLVLAMVASVGLLVWHGASADDTIELEIRTGTRVGRVRPIWDETNTWKLASLFGASRPDPARRWGPGWLRRHVPWARYVRVVAGLGGNHAPEIAPWCDYAIASPQHPDTRTTECGHEGVPCPAARDELVREGVTDYTPFRVAIERVLRSGALPHVNVSAAPSIFTGGLTDFTHYHWNAAPVRDFDGWAAFVRGAFRAVADLHPERWRVSITNEPNCLMMVGSEGDVQHVGFSGTPDDYARTFVTTARAIRAVAPTIALQAGNYVTSATFPGENNLDAYLRSLAAALAADDATRWDELRATSLSLYETSDTTLYDFVPDRIARLERAVRDTGLARLPIKVDELDIHPTISDPFEHRTGQNLDRTAYAASWHAEAVRQLVVTERVASVAPWLVRMFAPASFSPYPKARTYQLLGLLAGQLRTVAKADGPQVRRTLRRHGLPRLAVTGQVLPQTDPSHSRESNRSLAALATRTPHGFRVLVVHHQGRPVTDGDGLRRQMARPVRVRAREVAAGAYRVRFASVGTVGASWDGVTSPLRWHDGGCRRARDGGVEIFSTVMDANTVWLFDVVRHRRCPSRDPNRAS